MLRYTRCNIMILMAATVLHFLYCVCISFVYHTFQVSPEKIPPLWGHLKSKIYEWNPHMIQEMKDNINHAVAAIKITMLHQVYRNMVTARLLTKCSNTLRNIHTNARENITRTCAKRKAGYFFVAHPAPQHLLWPILLLHILKKCRCQLPDNGKIIAPKHVGTT